MVKRVDVNIRTATPWLLTLSIAVAGGALLVRMRQSTVVHRTIVDYTVLPPYRGLSPSQMLERSMQVPGVMGVVRGTTGVPTVDTVPGIGGRGTALVTDIPFAVTEVDGRPQMPYRVGTTIVLRVPGGRRGNVVDVYEGAPQVRANQDLFVFVRDQGVTGGGNTPSRIVASAPSDVLTVHDGMVVGGRGWPGVEEPLSTFRSHFAHR